MCIIKICKIFSCWHLEAIFSVARCERAVGEGLRYCNRTCHPPTLQADMDRQLIDPDTVLLDSIHMNYTLMRLFVRHDIDTLIDPAWAARIERARRTTLTTHSHTFHRYFVLEDGYPPFPGIEAVLSNNQDHPNPEMEVLLLNPCSSTCPHHPTTAPHDLHGLFSPPVPTTNSTDPLTRWAAIASTHPGATDAGVPFVLSHRDERQIAGQRELRLAEMIDHCVANGWLSATWVERWGLWPSPVVAGLAELQRWRQAIERVREEEEETEVWEGEGEGEEGEVRG